MYLKYFWFLFFLFQIFVEGFLPKFELPLSDKKMGLNVNCGIGDLLPTLKKQFPSLTFIGIDSNKKFIDICKDKYKEYEFVSMNIEKNTENLLKEKGPFQIIHVQDYENLNVMIDKTFPLLEKDGILYISYKEEDLPKIIDLQEFFDGIMYHNAKKRLLLLH